MKKLLLIGIFFSFCLLFFPGNGIPARKTNGLLVHRTFQPYGVALRR